MLLLIFFYIFNKISSMMFINNSQGECMALVIFFNFYLLNLYSRQCFTLGRILLLATTIPYPKATQHSL